jgi:hypothetical protein
VFFNTYRYSFFNNSEIFCTIFNLYEENRVTPLMWFQDDYSTVGYLVVTALAIFYGQHMDNNHAVGTLNISRLMRNYFSEEEIYDNVFLLQGGDPMHMLQQILKEQNAEQQFEIATRFSLRLDMPAEKVYDHVRRLFLDYGPLIIDNWKNFADMEKEDDQVVFHGNWSKYLNVAEHVPHALLIVGVGLVKNIRDFDEHVKVDANFMGGVAFLLQNSCNAKPFVIVGLDFLQSMGVDKVVLLSRGLKLEVDLVTPGNKPNGKVDQVECGCPETPHRRAQPMFHPQSGLPSPNDRNKKTKFDPSLWTPASAIKGRYIVT